MDKIFYLVLISVCIGNVAYIYFKGMDNRKMFYFIMGEMTLFLSAIVYNNIILYLDNNVKHKIIKKK